MRGLSCALFAWATASTTTASTSSIASRRCLLFRSCSFLVNSHRHHRPNRLAPATSSYRSSAFFPHRYQGQVLPPTVTMSTITEPKTISGRVADYAILAGEALAFTGAWSFPATNREEGEGGEGGVQPSPPHATTGGVRLLLRRSIRDVERDKQRTMLLNYIITQDNRWVEGSASPMELNGVVAMTASPSGGYVLLFKDEAKPEVAKEASESKPIVEVWSRSSLVATLPLDHAHGMVMGDSWFGGFSWSPDEKVLAYVAEVKRSKPETAFKPDDSNKNKKTTQPGGDSSGDTTTSSHEESGGGSIGKNNKFEYREDWGEKYDGVCNLGLYMLCLENGRVARVATTPTAAAAGGGGGGGDGGKEDGGKKSNAPTATPGQPVFSRDGLALVYTSWPTLPRKLGIIFCHQRPSSLFAIDVTDTIKALLLTEDAKPPSPSPPPPSPSPPRCLTPSDRLARSPVFSRDGTKLAYLANTQGFDTHNGPMELRVLDWQPQAAPSTTTTGGPSSSLTARTLVDIVPSPPSPSSPSFPGLWLENLPRECWSMDDACMYMTTMWGSKAVVIRVDAKSGAVTAMGPKAGEEPFVLPTEEGTSRDYSVSLLSITSKGLVILASSPRHPGAIGLLLTTTTTTTTTGGGSGGTRYIPGPKVERAAVCTSVFKKDRYADLRSALSKVEWRVLSIQPGKQEEEAAQQQQQQPPPPFEAILILPPPPPATASSPLPPLVVVPHGGPHSVMPTSFLHSYTYLTLTYGLVILHVNFRGSTGFGADPLASLPGRCGDQDVSDVLEATKTVLAMKVVDGDRVGIVGGSHGGFLSAHMIGQHPEVYKAAALRNPVTNIPGMVTSTDIPDWCFVEALGHGAYDFTSSRPPTPQQLQVMWDSSPIAHVNKVKAPTLIALGAKDRRVPYSQGIEYYHTLRSRGVPSKLLVYPEDVHAIDKPASEADHWIQIGDWLRQYL